MVDHSWGEFHSQSLSDLRLYAEHMVRYLLSLSSTFAAEILQDNSEPVSISCPIKSDFIERRTLPCPSCDLYGKLCKQVVKL